MNPLKTIEKILTVIKRDPSRLDAYTDAVDCIKSMGEDGMGYCYTLRSYVMKQISISMNTKDYKAAGYLDNVMRESYFYAAPYCFEDFIEAMEYDRDVKQKFYAPRKRILHQIACELPKLGSEYDYMFIVMPPGTGKSTIGIFFILWLAGLHPERGILTGSHSNAIMSGFYEQCRQMMTDSEYNWSKVFPDAKLATTNAKDLLLNIGKWKRFSTLQFTSVGSNNAGQYRAIQLLYCDDLISGSDEALSFDRLEKLWSRYTVDLKQRKQGTVPELHIATPWAPLDPISRLMNQFECHPRAKVIHLPAMDENDESNFNYDYGLGFTTNDYKILRDSMDSVSWDALYMGAPRVREGLLYPEDELRRYFELPQCEPDGIIAVVDTKNTGTDYGFMPVAYIYGEDFYIEDCVCTNAISDFVSGYLVEKLLEHDVGHCRFESNNAGGEIAKNVSADLKAKKAKTHITTAYTVKNKETRMVLESTWVKAHCLFKDRSLYQSKSQYGVMMRFLTSYTIAGKNKNDDVPDGMAQLSYFAQHFGIGKVEIMKRPF